MSHKNCGPEAKPFSFELPVTDGKIGFGNVTVEGFACKEHGRVSADIDRVWFESSDIKPVLEMYAGMGTIDHAALAHVKQMFETELKTAA